MRAQNWTDDEIMAMIKEGMPTREKALRHVFERKDWKGMVVGYILKNGGDPNDAAEIAVLALEYFDRNIRNGYFKGDSELKTYFFSIAKRQWYKQQKRKKAFVQIDPKRDDGSEANEEDHILRQDKRNLLERATGVLGESCKEVFQMKALGYSNEVMAERLGLANADMAKKKLYRCRRKFQAYLTENPKWKDLLN